MRILRHVVFGIALGISPLAGAQAAAEGVADPAFEVEAESEPGVEVETAPPVRDPATAWAAAQASLPAGHAVRRIAFAMHGVVLLHAPGGPRARTLVTFFDWMDGRYSAHATERYEGVACIAPGVDPVQVASALDRLLADRSWQKHHRSLDSLILECSGDTLFWWLLPVPEGGFREGVTFATVKVPFQP